ncbi:MAG: hypothetical protein R3220_05075 [Balneolaceae bacterium]|nr:hypothetical protein [Balneolaceae bacterium]
MLLKGGQQYFRNDIEIDPEASGPAIPAAAGITLFDLPTTCLEESAGTGGHSNHKLHKFTPGKAIKYRYQKEWDH